MYTIIKTGISGDLKWLWMMMGALMNYNIRSLGSGPFSVETCHEVDSRGMLKNWVPIVYTTGFRKSLVTVCKNLSDVISSAATNNEAIALKSRVCVEASFTTLEVIRHFTTTELKLIWISWTKYRAGGKWLITVNCM